MEDSDEDLDWSIHDISGAPELTEDRRRSLDLSVNRGGGGGRRTSLGSESTSTRVPPGRRHILAMSPRAWTSRGNRMDDSSSSSVVSTGMLRPRLRSTGGLDESTGSAASTGSGNRQRLWSTGSASSNHSNNPASSLKHVKSFPPVDRSGLAVNKRVAFAKPVKAELGLRDLPEDEPSIPDYGHEDAPSVSNRTRSDSYGDMSKASESVFSDGTSQNEEDEDSLRQTFPAEGSTIEDGIKRVSVLGYTLPEWMTNRPSWNRIASFIVTRSPCFWYCFSKQPTDREILARLNILCSAVGLVQLVSVMWLLIVSFSESLVNRSLDKVSDDGEQAPDEVNDDTGIEILLNFWNLNGAVYALGLLGFIVCTSAMLTLRVIRNVNLVGVIRYLWVLLWVLPFEILFVIGVFDYFRVTDVWIKHWWRDKSLAWFRKQFCSPSETFNSLCTVPISGNEMEWCLNRYNSTQCTSIRNSAQKDMDRFMLSFYWLNAGVGLILICLLFLAIMTLQGIVSRPLVQKSRESNVPAWFALPILGSFAIGIVYGFAESSGLSTQTDTEAAFVGPLFLAIGGLFLLSALLGWAISAYSILNTRAKRTKLAMILLFIGFTSALVVLLATVFSSSIAYSISLRAVPISDVERGEIACILDSVEGCSNCDSPDSSLKCPEWSRADVTKVIQTQAKGAASLASIFIIYALSAVRFGFQMRKHVTTYQIDYV